MKSQISSVDLHYLIQEMEFLKGSRVDKIYHPKKEELLLQFFVSSKGKHILRIIAGKFLFLSEHKEQYDEPSGFCMFLRKKLSNAKLKSISQIGSERVCLMGFDTKEGIIKLYAELFGKGNLVVTDKEDNILNALEQKKWSDRDIKKGVKYIFPRKEYDIFSISRADFFRILDSEKELVFKLAKDIGIGGVYAEEICLSAEVDKKKKGLDVKEKERVWRGFQQLLKNKVKANIIYRKGEINEIVPFPLKIFKEDDMRKFDSLNKAFDYFFREKYNSKEEFKSKHQQMIDKTRGIIEQQKKQIDALEKKSEENARKGEIIFEKYQLVEEILREINRARGKYSFDEIHKRLKGHKIIKGVDAKNKKITVEL